jgi:hypothetical protein
MSDFDPVLVDVRAIETDGYDLAYSECILSEEVPKLVALELRRQFVEHGDPGLWFLVLRAQELEQLM